MAGAPKTLETALLDELVVPFVGAGVSRAVRGTSGQELFPGWADLLEKAATKLRGDGKDHDANVVSGLVRKPHPDVMGAARYAREALHSGWYGLLRDELGHSPSSIDPASLALARAIWKISDRLVVTTNYDDVLLWGNPNPTEVINLTIDPVAELSAMLRGGLKRPTVWHLHGYIHDSANMILTPDGYSALYPDRDGVEVRYQAALHSIRHLLAARTMLFIGFSMDDERFGDQVEWVGRTFADSSGPHYLLVKESELRATQRRLKHLHNVECLSFADHGQPLVDKVEEIAAVRTAKRTMASPSPAAPKVVLRSAGEPRPVKPVPPEPPRSLGLASVRRSYRELHDHQRHLFDALARLSDSLLGLGLEFERWDPIYFSRTAKSSTEFFRRPYWAWDFLPAFALRLSWQSKSSVKGQAVRVVVEIENDSSFPGDLSSEPRAADFSAEPDAARSTLWLGLFKSSDPSVSWSQAWSSFLKEADPYDGKVHLFEDSSGKCSYQAVELVLDQWLGDRELNASVATRLQEWTERGIGMGFGGRGEWSD